jgi:hypothetical protein
LVGAQIISAAAPGASQLASLCGFRKAHAAVKSDSHADAVWLLVLAFEVEKTSA